MHTQLVLGMHLLRLALKTTLVTTFVLLFPAAFYISKEIGVFKIHTIEIQSKLEDQILENYLPRLRSSVAQFYGKNIWEVELSNIKEIVGQAVWIQEAQVLRRYPQTLRIEIVPKKAIAILLDKKRDFYLLSQEGTILPEIEKTNAPRLPVFQNPKVFVDKEMRQRLVTFLNSLPQEGELSLPQISEITIKNNNEIWITHLNTRAAIRMGDHDVPIKSARVARVLEYLEHNNLKWRVIDADFSKKVLVKLRNDR